MADDEQDAHPTTFVGWARILSAEVDDLVKRSKMLSVAAVADREVDARDAKITKLEKKIDLATKAFGNIIKYPHDAKIWADNALRELRNA